ncbi:CsbD family protein [Streptomyces sp. 8K308]|uniref:CsbD family protein n=1 Tax=Streptomyces sp. 8K308 TaxID=2530388 RepID=UPI0010519281|nr:CsbD family protein [Streptomyces sp. 8K308]TDC10019.1 CsbD family protein [Streptomyces sp. 8K308]
MNGGAMDRAKGKAKEMLGRITGDDRRRTAGRADQVRGGLRGAAGSAREKAKGVRDSLRNQRNQRNQRNR